MNTTTQQTVQPLLTDAADYRRFTGRYFLSQLKPCSEQAGNEMFELTLSDSSGDLTAYASYDQLLDEVILENSMVHVEVAALSTRVGTVRIFKNLLCAANSKRMGNSLSVLPISLCPQPDVLKAFLVLATRISSPLLRKFLDDALLQPKVGISYLQCPATMRGHHSYAGGLLEHSVEVAWNVAGVHALSPIERDVAVVAALLHGIGRTKTFSTGTSRTELGAIVAPEFLTLEICAEALSNLEGESPALANHLRHIWASLAESPHTHQTSLICDVMLRSVKSSMRTQQSMAFLADAETDTPIFA